MQGEAQSSNPQTCRPLKLSPFFRNHSDGSEQTHKHGRYLSAAVRDAGGDGRVAGLL